MATEIWITGKNIYKLTLSGEFQVPAPGVTCYIYLGCSRLGSQSLALCLVVTFADKVSRLGAKCSAGLADPRWIQCGGDWKVGLGLRCWSNWGKLTGVSWFRYGSAWLRRQVYPLSWDWNLDPLRFCLPVLPVFTFYHWNRDPLRSNELVSLAPWKIAFFWTWQYLVSITLLKMHKNKTTEFCGRECERPHDMFKFTFLRSLQSMCSLTLKQQHEISCNGEFCPFHHSVSNMFELVLLYAVPNRFVLVNKASCSSVLARSYIHNHHHHYYRYHL